MNKKTTTIYVDEDEYKTFVLYSKVLKRSSNSIINDYIKQFNSTNADLIKDTILNLYSTKNNNNNE